jgi:hypothetical protein
VLNPDRYAEHATYMSKAGLTEDAFNATARAIEARAHWVLVNGTWTPRAGIMRTNQGA